MGKDLVSGLRPAAALMAVFALLLGLAYPLAITGIGQALFPHAANGSIVMAGGRAIGSQRVGQRFASPRYFRSRPSAAGEGYDAAASSGSNLAPASRALADRVAADVAGLRAEGVTGPLPADLVTASGSGLDPDLSPAAARVQVPRVARVRGLPEPTVRALVERATRRPLLGEPHVNLLALNRALDAASVGDR